MKSVIIAISALSLLIITSPAFSEDKETNPNKPAPFGSFNTLQANKISVGDINNDGKIDSSDLPQNDGDLTVSGNVGIGTLNPAQKLDVNGFVKGQKGVCVGEDCKASWPILKCADFADRPQGETGDTFCNSQAKTCMSVLIGSGASFYNECSTSPYSKHSTRCCWVE
jgi:hypothetical protein